jgi:hypothetical protein
LHYIQGAGSRDLESLRRADVEEFISPDALTRTVSGFNPSIESYVLISDGLVTPFRLEGTTKKSSQVMVLCTFAGLSWSVWDDLVDVLLKSTGRKAQVLRLRFPVRVQDADRSLNHTTIPQRVAQDLKDSFKALMMQKADVILMLGLGGRTASEAAKNPGREIEKGTDPNIAQLCSRDALMLFDSQSSLARMMDDLKKAISKVSTIAEVMDKVLQK